MNINNTTMAALKFKLSSNSWNKSKQFRTTINPNEARKSKFEAANVISMKYRANSKQSNEINLKPSQLTSYASYVVSRKTPTCNELARLTNSPSLLQMRAYLFQIIVSFCCLLLIINPLTIAQVSGRSLPDLVSGTSDDPIYGVVGQDAYISCVANNLQNYTIIWRFSTDAHAPALAANSSSQTDISRPLFGLPKLVEDAEVGASILTAGRQRVTSDDRFSVIRSHNTWLLKIKSVRLTDTGTYFCETNSEPRVRAIRILSVIKSKNRWPLAAISSSEELIDRGKHIGLIDHNFTECCRQELIFPRCLKLCSLQQLASKYHTINMVHECYSALPPITRCMVAGRNVVDCCNQRHVPSRCHYMCGISPELAMSVSIQDQTYCADYSASVMSCVAQGISYLPGQPELVIVEALSSSSLKISWQRVNDEAEYNKIDSWVINLTKLSSFEDTISLASQPFESISMKTNMNSTTSPGDYKFTSMPANASLIDAGDDSSLSAMIRNLASSPNGTISVRLDKKSNEFTMNGLKPYTVYQVQMFSFNSAGRSQLSDPIRALTLAPENDLPPAINSSDIDSPRKESQLESEDQVDTNLPDTRKCCESRGVTLRKCIDTLCDPVEADHATIEDLMICAPWSNITFSCLSSRVDHSDCCRARGVTPFCMPMCSGEIKKFDYRHFRCLTHMSTYTNCILESHDVLPSPPQNFTIGPITSAWVVLNWRPPKRKAKSVQGYRIFWRRVDTGSDDMASNTRIGAMANDSMNGSAPINDEHFFISSDAATNPYLLDSLIPDSVYETYVVAINRYGQSKQSPRVIFRTLDDASSSNSRTESNGDIESRLPLSGKDLHSVQYYNETNCCLQSGIPSSCRQLCDYDLKVTDAFDLTSHCSMQMPSIIRCLAGNRNSVPCCRTNGVSDTCLNVCAGLTEHSPLLIATQCGPDFGKILRCLDEGSKQIPSAPQDLHAIDVKSDRVTVTWQPANEDKFRTDIEYHVRYQQLESSIVSDDSESNQTSTSTDLSSLIAVVPLHPLEHNHILTTNDTQATIQNLKPGSRVSLYMTAENSYGISLPSLVLVLELPRKDSSSTKQHNRNATIGAPRSLEILRSDTDSMVVKWASPLYVESDSQIRYRVFYKRIGPSPSALEIMNESEHDSSDQNQNQNQNSGQTRQLENSNWTSSETAYTSIALTSLVYSSQYAITVQAYTRKLRGHMSELLLASTAKPVPPSINPPFIINQPIEGNNITIICAALGQPTPEISMFINGLLVQRRTDPYVVYHLVNLVRGQLVITCLATNGRGRDYASVQSRTDISVKFPPKSTAKDKIITGTSNSLARLSCSVSGNPQPRVSWAFVPANSSGPSSIIIPNDRVTTIFANQLESAFSWIHTLTIKNLFKSDAGIYTCHASNQLNESLASQELRVNEVVNSKIIDSYKELQLIEGANDLTKCCVAQNVSSKCQPACLSDGLDIELIYKTPECHTDLDKLMYCAADNSDHRQCCNRRLVPFSCLRWCSGNKLNSSALCFLSAGIDINQCFLEGRTNLPGPPRNIRAILASESTHFSSPSYQNPTVKSSSRISPVISGSLSRYAPSITNMTSLRDLPINPFVDMSEIHKMKLYERNSTSPTEAVIIEWDLPSKNPMLVQYYRVVWYSPGNSYLMRTITNLTWIMVNLEIDRTYEFAVRAANVHGTSIYSESIVVKPNQLTSSSSLSWFIGQEASHGSLLGRIAMSMTFASGFMFAILALVIYLERHGYLSRFSSSKSNASRISFANPAYLKESNSSSSSDDTNDKLEFSNSDGSSFSRSSSEGRGSGNSKMRFETVTWDDAEPQAGHSMHVLGLPPIVQIESSNSIQEKTNSGAKFEI